MKNLFSAALLVMFLTSVVKTSFAETLDSKITKDTAVSGDVTINGDVVVEKGATLTIKEGTKITFKKGVLEIYGTLMVQGTAASPINVIGTKSGYTQGSEVRIINSKEKESKISYCNFNGMNTGVAIENSKVTIENSTFVDNGIAIDTKQKDESTIIHNVIKNSSKVGIFCKNDSSAKIVDNKISGVKKFGVYVYRSGKVQVAANEITNCGDGIFVGYVGSNPSINNNKISLNDIGIAVEKGANPDITRNFIFNNEIGISVSKRSDPQISIENHIYKNKKGIFITYSSYPIITGNNIYDNDYAIYLEFQSAQWEKELGDSMKRGGEKKVPAKTPGSAFSVTDIEEFVAPKKNLSDKVVAKYNYWGDVVIKEMAEKGKIADISAIYDYYDAKDFTYEGKKYKLDTVDYSSWSEKPVFIGEKK